MTVHEEHRRPPIVPRHRSTPVWVSTRNAPVIRGIISRIVANPATSLFWGGLGNALERIRRIDRPAPRIGDVRDTGRFSSAPSDTGPLGVRPRGEVTAADAEVHAVIGNSQI